MPTTELDLAWFVHSAFSSSVSQESNSQLTENKFDGTTMLIEVASISEQSSKRFQSLRAINVNGRGLFPASHFQPADDFGGQFLSHAVFASLFDQHISELRTADEKLLHNSVLGEVQTQFYLASSPEYTFCTAAQWDSRKQIKQVQKFQIERPSKKVRDYVHLRRIEVKHELLTGNRKSEKELEDFYRDCTSVLVGASLSSDETVRLFQRSSELLRGIPETKLAKDFLDFRNMLGVVFNCGENPVTPSDYRQFMIDWNSAPQPIQGATEIEGLLWKWLYLNFPDDRNKYFHTGNMSKAVIDKKTQARSRRLKHLKIFLNDAVAKAKL